jgi:ketosteroid isomerase-like protein
MRRPLALLAFVGLAACQPKSAEKPAQPSTAADEAAIRHLTVAWDSAYNARSADAIVAGYVDSAYRMEAYVPVVIGRAAIREMFQRAWQASNDSSFDTVDEVRIVGDLAAVRGHWRSSVHPSRGAAYEQKGKWASACQRQADGSWKTLWDIWNEDATPRPATK